MIIIGKTLISDDVYLEHFICNLQICKGGCCVEGDAGAPLEENETLILQDIYPIVKPFMSEKGINTVEEEGLWVKDFQGDHTTPLVEGGQCAYVFYDGEGIAKCAIEKAWDLGMINYRKPVSCNLYPIRVVKYPDYDALNYHHWPICNCARKKGKKLKIRVYQFLKEPLIRQYGQEWYDELEAYIRFAFEGHE